MLARESHPAPSRVPGVALLAACRSTAHANDRYRHLSSKAAWPISSRFENRKQASSRCLPISKRRGPDSPVLVSAVHGLPVRLIILRFKKRKVAVHIGSHHL